jgi:hypothetical protein
LKVLLRNRNALLVAEEGVSIAITLKRVYFLPQPQLQLYLHLLQSQAQLQFPSPLLQEQPDLPFPMPTIFSMK